MNRWFGRSFDRLKIDRRACFVVPVGEETDLSGDKTGREIAQERCFTSAQKTGDEKERGYGVAPAFVARIIRRTRSGWRAPLFLPS